MPTRVELQYSKNRVKQAGKALRRPSASNLAELRDALEVLDHWRACHSYPLQKATMGLRSRVNTEDCVDPRISQRLKRRPTIIDKLQREPSMQVTTMQDIGGCRAVLADVNEVRRVQRRWTRTSHRVTRVYDYMSHPKPSGYRGVHVVVQYDGFAVEVQLRTRLQHAWSIAIEKVGPRVGSCLPMLRICRPTIRVARSVTSRAARAPPRYSNCSVPSETFLEVIDAVSPDVLRLVGLQIVDDRIRLVLP